jgi:hypothetical protein
MGHDVTLRRLTRADASQYRAFRLDALTHSPSAFTSTVREESERPLEWFGQRIAGAGPRDFILGAFDHAGV